jgi:hypothetical protein
VLVRSVLVWWGVCWAATTLELRVSGGMMPTIPHRPELWPDMRDKTS